MKITGNTIVSSSVASRTLALDGVGCGLLPDYMVDAEIVAGRLISLLPDYRPIGSYGSVFALHLPSRQGNPKVRVFIDWLVESLAESSE